MGSVCITVFSEAAASQMCKTHTNVIYARYLEKRDRKEIRLNIISD